jgi:hypothetical protein
MGFKTRIAFVRDFRLDLWIIVGIDVNAGSDRTPINLKAFKFHNLYSDFYLSLSAEPVETRMFSVRFHVFTFLCDVCLSLSSA